MDETRREELHALFIDFLGSSNVYYQPPEGLQMKYPCIAYFLNNVGTRYADNKIYSANDSYEVQIIDKKPDSSLPKRFLESFSYCRFDRKFNADNLNHFVFNVYY